MARLIRMDGTGHTTLAEWTAEDDAAFAEARRGVPRRSSSLATSAPCPRARQGHARARAAARRRPRDHAPADRRRLAAGRGPPARRCPSSPRSRGAQRTDARWLRRWGRIWHAWTLLYTVPFAIAGVGDAVARAARGAGRARGLAHAWIIPELYAFRGASVVRPKGPRNERARAGRAGPARRPARPRRARAPARAPASRSSAASWASGWWARPARCWSPPARAGGALLLRAARPSPSCRRPTASPTCCWPCATDEERLRDGRQPRVRGRAVAGAPPPAGSGCARRSTPGRRDAPAR